MIQTVTLEVRGLDEDRVRNEFPDSLFDHQLVVREHMTMAGPGPNKLGHDVHERGRRHRAAASFEPQSTGNWDHYLQQRTSGAIRGSLFRSRTYPNSPGNLGQPMLRADIPLIAIALMRLPSGPPLSPDVM